MTSSLHSVGYSLPRGQQHTPAAKKLHEELDKLLGELDRLTENLPDLTHDALSLHHKAKSDSDLSFESLWNAANSLGTPGWCNNNNNNIDIKSGSNVQQLDENNIRPSRVMSNIKLLKTRETQLNSDKTPTSSYTTKSSWSKDISQQSNRGRMEESVVSLNIQPYHTRADSKPFSYIRTSTGSKPPSRNASRASSRDGMATVSEGLESPRLLRKIMNGDVFDGGSCPLSPSTQSSACSSPASFSTWIHGQDFANASRVVPSKTKTTPVPVYATVKKVPEWEENNSCSSGVSSVNNSSLIKDMSNATDKEVSLTWLQKQQRKLQERRAHQSRREKRAGNDENVMMELRSSLTLARSPIEARIPSVCSEVSNQSCVDMAATTSTPLAKAPQFRSDISSPFRPPEQTFSALSLSDAASPPQLLQRQKSDISFNRSRPINNARSGTARRLRYASESEAQPSQQHYCYVSPSAWQQPDPPPRVSSISLMSDEHKSLGSHRIKGSLPTPGFLGSNGGAMTPYTNLPPNAAATLNRLQKFLQRSTSPASSSAYGVWSRRGSTSSSGTEVATPHVKRGKDSYHHFWYKPTISREEAIELLRHRPSGAFVVRDSNSFPGAFGLALKVSSPPTKSLDGDTDDELVRHFLIEPTSKGVKLKGYSNEPSFASLSALIYHHTLLPLALPTTLVLPHSDMIVPPQSMGSAFRTSAAAQMKQLLSVGAACNVIYLFTMDTDSLTGPTALARAITQLLTLTANNSATKSAGATPVHFKISIQGITLTDNNRRLFFRKHFSAPHISFCGLDPNDRKWTTNEDETATSVGMFGFIARKPTAGHNQCHVFAEMEHDQPASAIVTFVNRVLVQCKSSGYDDSTRSFDIK